ncbi:hypothetical protein H5410_007056 [Solanum commersonii]|uniref:Uncharacterized protein n=1 Tax=Solanum commersonii TaxID=4109 RepID=A0A9J6AAV5_SOLCO|nr:hypothetical protein H5410_007056 [Solanum commersonii]
MGKRSISWPAKVDDDEVVTSRLMFDNFKGAATNSFRRRVTPRIQKVLKKMKPKENLKNMGKHQEATVDTEKVGEHLGNLVSARIVCADGVIVFTICDKTKDDSFGKFCKECGAINLTNLELALALSMVGCKRKGPKM